MEIQPNDAPNHKTDPSRVNCLKHHHPRIFYTLSFISSPSPTTQAERAKTPSQHLVYKTLEEFKVPRPDPEMIDKKLLVEKSLEYDRSLEGAILADLKKIRKILRRLQYKDLGEQELGRHLFTPTLATLGDWAAWLGVPGGELGPGSVAERKVRRMLQSREEGLTFFAVEQPANKKLGYCRGCWC